MSGKRIEPILFKEVIYNLLKLSRFLNTFCGFANVGEGVVWLYADFCLPFAGLQISAKVHFVPNWRRFVIWEPWLPFRWRQQKGIEPDSTFQISEKWFLILSVIGFTDICKPDKIKEWKIKVSLTFRCAKVY